MGAGPLDVLKVEIEFAENVEIVYGVGDTYTNAYSKIDSEALGKTIVAEFPRTLFVTVMADVQKAGSFGFIYWTTDDSPSSSLGTAATNSSI